MGYIPFTDNETNQKKPLRQALGKKLKDNDDDHETRISGLQGLTSDAVFDHFIRSMADGDVIADVPIYAAFHRNDVEIDTEGTATAESKIILLPGADHIARSQSQYKNDALFNEADARFATVGVIRMTPAMLPRFVCRARQVSSWSSLASWFIGVVQISADPISAGAHGVFLEITGSQLRFVTRNNSANTIGTAFTRPSADVWFEVDIKWTAVDTIECRFDGALKETFTSADNVPDSADEMAYKLSHSATNLGDATNNIKNVDFDRTRELVTSFADST